MPLIGILFMLVVAWGVLVMGFLFLINEKIDKYSN